MRLGKVHIYALILMGALLLGSLIYRLPAMQDRLYWRLDMAAAYLRGVLRPVGKVPTPLPPPRVVTTALPTPTLTAIPSDPADEVNSPPLDPIPSPTPNPTSVTLPAPAWEKQDINNCGPASLAMYLRFYGWQGDQFDIAELIKPQRDDRNVNVEELVYYVRIRAGWLNTLYRVGGDIPLLKRFLAAGIPVLVEETFRFDQPFWPNDDLWAAHYNLLTGYDDTTQTFIAQDSFHGPDQEITYQKLDEDWHAFNRVYILIYPPSQEETIKSILGIDWDEALNRQRALEVAQAETRANPNDAFAWFNLGSNLVYFERYAEAATAFDQARRLGLPQRMLRYQFTPFFAYFHTRRIDELLALSEYALKITPNAEEARLWHGWALYRKGDRLGAMADFQAALDENPNYADARYALDFVRQNP